MRNIRTIKTEADVRQFASLDFTKQRLEVMQAYYSDLFDLWEECPIHWDAETDQMLKEQRWKVYDYCAKRHFHLDRDSQWMCHYTEDGKLHELLTR